VVRDSGCDPRVPKPESRIPTPKLRLTNPESRLPILNAIVDVEAAERCGWTPTDLARALLAGGARFLQLRAKGLTGAAFLDTAKAIVELARPFDAMVIVNDRADIALLLNAGLHLGQDDIPPQDARRLLGSSPILGYSTHNDGQLAAAGREPASYLALGPMFPTQSKINPDPVVGIERLRAWRRLTDKPLVAIGGITRDNARSVLESGADSVAVIGDLLPVTCSAASIRERMREWQRTIGPHE